MPIVHILLLLFLLIILGILTLNLLTFPFYVYAMIRGAFYAPTPKQKVESMLQLTQNRQIKRMADIGSGDGRIVASFAKEGVQSDGYEINPMLVLRSRFNIVRQGLRQKAHIYLQDFWYADFSQYDLVTVYGITRIMPKLQEKLERELKPGAIIISNHFQFPHWKIKDRIGDVILYEIERKKHAAAK
jgi:hypothetical protein